MRRNYLLCMQPFCTLQALNHKGTTGICRAGLEDDAPFAVAIAASVLSTLVLPFEGETEEEANKGVSPLGGDDVRYAAMGIISFIPLFNWLVSYLSALSLFGREVYRS